MMLRIIYLFIFVTNTVFAQKHTNPKIDIYSHFLIEKTNSKDIYAHCMITSLSLNDPFVYDLITMDLDFEYLDDYLNGNIKSNKTYQDFVKPDSIHAALYFNMFNNLLGTKLKENRLYGELLMKLKNIGVNTTDLKKILISNFETEIVKKVNLKRIRRKGWDKFHHKHKNSYGVIKFSDIVFTAENNLACFFVEHHMHNLAGSGNIVFMKKTNEGKWEIDFEMTVWMS